jgi:hypothetical protein
LSAFNYEAEKIQLKQLFVFSLTVSGFQPRYLYKIQHIFIMYREVSKLSGTINTVRYLTWQAADGLFLITSSRSGFH